MAIGLPVLLLINSVSETLVYFETNHFDFDVTRKSRTLSVKSVKSVGKYLGRRSRNVGVEHGAENKRLRLTIEANKAVNLNTFQQTVKDREHLNQQNMKILTLFLSLFGLVLARETAQDILTETAAISIQTISSSTNPVTPLAEIKYNPSTLSSELLSFEVPDIPSDVKLARVGIYDAATSQWKSSTSVTSVEMFAKGYAPTVVLSLDAQGEVIGISLKGGTIDAGQTRDFAPRIKVLKMGKAKVPSLRKPKVVSEKAGAAGEEEVVEKTFLQKYWWMILGVMMLVLTSGGGGEEKK